MAERLVLALWFPYLATERLERRDPALAAKPFATFLESRGQLILGAVNPGAAEAGLTPGMTLANARALLPDITLRPGEPGDDLRLLEKLRGWSERYTPWVALDGVDGLFLDVTGCAHLFGDEATMMRDCVERLDGIGFTALAGLAPTKLGAAALARFCDGAVPPVMSSAHLREVLSPLPVEALRLTAEAADGVHRVGLNRIGDLLPLPRASLASRYGLDLVNRLDRALGDQADPISPKRFTMPWRTRLNFPDPIGLPDDLVAGVKRLVARLSQRLEREQKGCRRLELSVFRVDGEVTRLSVGAAEAVRDPDHLARLFGERLGSIDPGFGIESMVLTGIALEDVSARQEDADQQDDGQVGKAAPGLSKLTDRLASRLGEGAILRAEPCASHMPERATRYTSLYLPPAPKGKSLKAADREAPAYWPDWQGNATPRPTLILPVPEKLGDSVTAPLPGARWSFRWRGRDHGVRRMSGPERISPEWWRHPPENRAGVTVLDDLEGQVRDYYRVEGMRGELYWMFRPAIHPGWYMHGVFA